MDVCNNRYFADVAGAHAERQQKSISLKSVRGQFALQDACTHMDRLLNQRASHLLEWCSILITISSNYAISAMAPNVLPLPSYCYGDEPLSGVIEIWLWNDADWFGQLFCLDVFFAFSLSPTLLLLSLSLLSSFAMFSTVFSFPFNSLVRPPLLSWSLSLPLFISLSYIPPPLLSCSISRYFPPTFSLSPSHFPSTYLVPIYRVHSVTLLCLFPPLPP